MNTKERIKQIKRDLPALDKHRAYILKLQLEALVIQAQVEQLEKK